MISVKEVIELNSITILICENFHDDIITDTLVVTDGIFKQEDFIVEDIKNCFSAPLTRNIVIKKTGLFPKISKIKFV